MLLLLTLPILLICHHYYCQYHHLHHHYQHYYYYYYITSCYHNHHHKYYYYYYYYYVSKPREYVMKMLPLAKVGLKVVCGSSSSSRPLHLSCGSTAFRKYRSIHRPYSSPAPSRIQQLHSASWLALAAPCNHLEIHTYDDYKELQERAKMQSGAAGFEKEQEKSMAEGYCDREIRYFLNAKWSSLPPLTTTTTSADDLQTHLS